MAIFEGRLEVLAASSIHQHPDNIRADLGDLTQLIADIKEMGLVSPLVVYPHPDRQGDFVVQDGNRRRAACLQAGVSEIPCVVLPSPKRGAKADIETMLTTGRNHRLLTEAEVSKGVQMLLDLGLDETTIGKKFKMPRKEVRARAKVAEKDDGVSRAYSAGRLTLETVQRLQTLEVQAEDPQIYDRVVERIESMVHGASLETVERVIEDTERNVTKDRNRSKLQELEAVEAPVDAPWARTYTKVEEELSFEEHHQAGHQWRMDYYDSEPTWYIKKAVPAPVVVEPTAEEIAEKQYRQRMDSKMSIVMQRRQKFAIAKLQSKQLPENPAKEIMVDSIFRQTEHDTDLLALLGQIAYLEMPEQGEDQSEADYDIELKQWESKVRRNLAKLSLTQLVLILKFVSVALYGLDLDDLDGFERSEEEGRAWFGGWNRTYPYYRFMIDALGYELDPDEADVMLHFAKNEPKRSTKYDIVQVPDDACQSCGTAPFEPTGADICTGCTTTDGEVD